MGTTYGHTPDQKEMRAHALEILRSESCAVLATSTTAGEPQAGIMYFLADDNFDLYFFTARDSQKAKNIEHNKHVAVVVGLGPSPVTIQIGGDAVIVDDIEAHLFWRLTEKVNVGDVNEWPLSKLSKEAGFVAIRVTPRWMSMLDMSGDRQTHFHDFQKVISQT